LRQDYCQSKGTRNEEERKIDLQEAKAPMTVRRVARVKATSRERETAEHSSVRAFVGAAVA
jgi:hypothetical protein